MTTLTKPEPPEFIYIIEDTTGNREEVAEHQALSRLNDNRNWKLHIYRRFRTIGEVGQ